MKNESSVILENSTWLLGDGQTIRFWTNAWCWEPLVNLVIAQNPLIDKEAKVADFIQNYQWSIPQEFHNFCPQISYLVMQVRIPPQTRKDELIWKHVSNGSLTLKDAYNFKSHQLQEVSCKQL